MLVTQTLPSILTSSLLIHTFYLFQVATVHAAKIQNKNPNLHVICVFTENWTDKDDVMRVEKELRSLGVTGVIRYKPDIYTHLNLYHGNKYGIKTTIYESKDKKQSK